MKRVEIYTDGSATPGGKGGWAALLRYKGHEKLLVGCEAQTTHNRMELKAAHKVRPKGVTEALRALKEPCEVHLYTDSEYLKKAFATDSPSGEPLGGWLDRWQKNGWKTSEGKPVKNRDLWEALLQEVRRHKVFFHWIKGHKGHKENELVDRLARKTLRDCLENQDGA